MSALQGLDTLDFGGPVCCFVGENGSGKSTLMEALAIATGLPTVGTVSASRDRSLEAQGRLARCLKLVWNQRTHRGFFLRAEDFFGFARRLGPDAGSLGDEVRTLEGLDDSVNRRAWETGAFREVGQCKVFAGIPERTPSRGNTRGFVSLCRWLDRYCRWWRAFSQRSGFSRSS